MQRSFSAPLQELAAALLNLNEVAQRGQGSTTHSWSRRRAERKAVVRYCNALELAVAHDPSWKKLARDAGTRQPSTWEEPPELIKLVASTLLLTHADILRQCGYRSPPPPDVEDLLGRTRKSVIAEGRRPQWGPQHLNNVRFALAYFSNMLRVHLGNPGGMSSSALLGRVRRLGSESLLLLLLAHVEVETGDALEVRLGVTTKDHLAFTVVAPVDGPDIADFVASLVNAQMSNLDEAMSLGWIGLSRDEASLSDWYESAQARADRMGDTESDDDHGLGS